MVLDDLTDSARGVVELFEAQQRELPHLFVTVDGSSCSTVASLSRVLATATPTVVDDVHRQLARNEGEVRRRRNLRAQNEAEDERRAAAAVPLTDEEMAPIRESARESQRLAEYRSSTEGRLEAIEGILGEIRDALVKR